MLRSAAGSVLGSKSPPLRDQIPLLQCIYIYISLSLSSLSLSRQAATAGHHCNLLEQLPLTATSLTPPEAHISPTLDAQIATWFESLRFQLRLLPSSPPKFEGNFGRLIFIYLQCWEVLPFSPIQRQRCIKLRVLRAHDFYTPLNCEEGQHLSALEVYKNQSPKFWLRFHWRSAISNRFNSDLRFGHLCPQRNRRNIEKLWSALYQVLAMNDNQVCQESHINPWPRYSWKVLRYTYHFYRDTSVKVCCRWDTPKFDISQLTPQTGYCTPNQRQDSGWGWTGSGSTGCFVRPALILLTSCLAACHHLSGFGLVTSYALEEKERFLRLSGLEPTWLLGFFRQARARAF